MAHIVKTDLERFARAFLLASKNLNQESIDRMDLSHETLLDFGLGKRLPSQLAFDRIKQELDSVIVEELTTLYDRCQSKQKVITSCWRNK